MTAKISNRMKRLQIYRAAHSGEILGTLFSQVKRNLKISKTAVKNLIDRKFVVVDVVELPDFVDPKEEGLKVYNPEVNNG